MNRSDIDRLRDACDFARHAQYDAGGLSAVVLADAPQPLHAALYDLIVIGETLNKVSAEVKSAAPNLGWKPIINMRNILVHAYWRVDLALVAEVIERRLDPLITELEQLIAFVERSEQ
jgi:uncharacterized protein with HEPN domain